jgi:Leucine-rich repeat (LRR) protein
MLACDRKCGFTWINTMAKGRPFRRMSGTSYSNELISRRVDLCRRTGWKEPLDLANTNWTIGDVVAISTDERAQSALTTLNLSQGNGFTFRLTKANKLQTQLSLQLSPSVDAKALASALAPLTNLMSLELSGIGLSEATELKQVLAPLKNLVRLNLFGNGLYDAAEAGNAFICLPHLRVLNLGGNRLGNVKDLARAFAVLCELESLDLFGNGLSSPSELGVALAPLAPQLNALNIGGNFFRNLGELSLALEPLIHLTFLSLWGNGLSDGDWSRLLHPLGGLSDLDLGFNHISDATHLTEAFADLGNLTALRLGGNDLCDLPGLTVALQPARLLKLLDLFGNGFSDASQFGSALGSLSGVRSINLGGNGLCDSAGLARALQPLAQLEAIDLFGNDLGSLGELGVALGSLQHLVELNLGGNSLENAKDLAATLSNISGLKVLNLYNVETVLPIDRVRAASKVLGLQSLNIGGNALHDVNELVRELELLPQLEVLNLSSTDLDDQGVKHLVRLTKLRHLILSDCTRITDLSLLRPLLPPIGELRHLDAVGCVSAVSSPEEGFLHQHDSIALHLSPVPVSKQAADGMSMVQQLDTDNWVRDTCIRAIAFSGYLRKLVEPIHKGDYIVGHSLLEALCQLLLCDVDGASAKASLRLWLYSGMRIGSFSFTSKEALQSPPWIRSLLNKTASLDWLDDIPAQETAYNRTLNRACHRIVGRRSREGEDILKIVGLSCNRRRA